MTTEELIDLGVIRWSSILHAYVLYTERHVDLPLKFHVWTTR